MKYIFAFITVILFSVHSLCAQDVHQFVGTWNTENDGYWRGIRIKKIENGLSISIKNVDNKIYNSRVNNPTENCLYWSALINTDYIDGYVIFGNLRIDNEDCGRVEWYWAGEQALRQAGGGTRRIYTDKEEHLVEFKFVPADDYMTLYFRNRYDYLKDNEKYYYKVGEWVKYGDYTDW